MNTSILKVLYLNVALQLELTTTTIIVPNFAFQLKLENLHFVKIKIPHYSERESVHNIFSSGINVSPFC